MTSPKLFPTQEVGSLRKPLWLVEKLRAGNLSPLARKELDAWAKKLPGASKAALSVTSANNGSASHEEIRNAGSLFGLRYLESAGLDLVYDGEMRRVEMYEYPIRHAQGFKFLGTVKSFDNKYYLKAACVDEVGLKEPYHLDEFRYINANAKGIPKVPVTGAYTLADWSWNEHYLKLQKGWKGPEQRRAAQREFAVDVARKILRPTLLALVKAGAKNIQIDEPAAGTHPDETDIVVESFNESTVGVDAKLSMHVCFSDYRSLFPGLLEAKRCKQFQLEFANRDVEGNDGYSDLAFIGDHDTTREIGLGVLDIHRDVIESPELVEQRISRAVKYLKDPSRILVNPDCGLRTRSLDVSWQKLTNMVKGTELARAKFS